MTKVMHGVAGLWLVLAATGAGAQGLELAEAQEEAPVESPRSGMLELKLGHYTPRLPQYEAFFGAPMLLFEVEYERQLYQGIGTLAFGLSAGYGEKFAGQAGTRSGFRAFPLRVLGVYRFDWLAQEVGVPLVPFVKAGLVGIPWSVVKGSQVEVYDGRKAQGLELGYQGTLGLALQLDFLQPRMARDFDSSLGVNHSYLFAEYTAANVNDFGRGDFDLSQRGFMFGLGLEF